jgi:glycosyltransferase 2 family protein
VRGRRGRLLLGVAAAALLLALFFRGVDWGDLAHALETARPGYLAGVAVVTLGVYAARAWRWGNLLAPLGRVGFADLFSATMVGFASALLIPRAGEIVRPWLVSRRHPIPTSAGFATIILERLMDLITVLVLFAAYLFVLPTPAAEVQGRTMDLVQAAGAVAGAAAGIVLVVLFALHSRTDQVAGRLERLLARAPRWLSDPAGRTVRAFSGGLAVLRAPPLHLATLFAQSLLVWLLIALAFYLNHLAFSIDLPFHATFLLIAFLVVGVAIPTPGMVGGFHAFYLLALTEVYGIDRTTAAAAGIAAHALTNLPILVLGLVLLGREGLSLGRVAEVAEEGGAPSGKPVALPMRPEAR